MFGQNPNKFYTIGHCWKCGSRIKYNEELDEYQFTNPDCLCQLAQCSLCNEIDSRVEPIYRYWTGASDSQQLIQGHPAILVCPDCMKKYFSYCADCEDPIQTDDDDFEFCLQCINNRKEAA